MSTLTTTTSAAPRIRSAGQHAVTLDPQTQSRVLAEVIGSLAGLAAGLEDGIALTPCRLADLIDRAVSHGIGAGLREGDRVTLAVNDVGGTVIGLVDAIRQEPRHGATVIDVELPDGRIFPQSARFVKPVRR